MQHRGERLTLIRIFEALRGLGYEGGYDAVRRYARVWQRDQAATSVGAFIPLSFAPGEAYLIAVGNQVTPVPRCCRFHGRWPNPSSTASTSK
jgi:hypothetical protein